MKGFVGDLNLEYSFTLHSITLNSDGDFNQNDYAQLVFDIATVPTPVPEPATLALLGTAAPPLDPGQWLMTGRHDCQTGPPRANHFSYGRSVIDQSRSQWLGVL